MALTRLQHWTDETQPRDDDDDYAWLDEDDQSPNDENDMFDD